MRGILAIVAAATMAALAFAWWPSKQAASGSVLTSHRAQVSTITDAVSTDAPVLSEIPSRRLGASKPYAETQPASLAGTEVDGHILVSPSGALIADHQVRRMMDYWLSTLGELSLPEIRAQFEAAARDAGGVVAAAEAAALFDAYVGYLKAAESINPSSLHPAELSRVHAELYRLRREMLGELWSEAFFADEEADLIEQIARIEIRSDPALTDTERTALLENLDQTSPAPMREARWRATAHHQVMQQDAELANLSSAEKHRARTEAYGVDAADRLAALDHDRARWETTRQRFMDAYFELQELELDELARQQRMSELLMGYSEPERRRLLAQARIPTGQ